MFVELSDYTLYYDGSISVDPKNIYNHLDAKKLYVDYLTDEIIQYNKNVVSDNQITIKKHLDGFDKSWNIPEEYLKIDVIEYIDDKFIELCIEDGLNDADIKIRYKRIKNELKIYEKLELFDVLRCMIYIIDTFKDKDVVWGVGRGSSVASYILYVLEVHDIDSVKFNLDFNEFLGK